MGFDFIKKLPTPEEIRNQFPIDANFSQSKMPATKNLKMFLQANLINFSQSLVHVPQTMKMQCWTI